MEIATVATSVVLAAITAVYVFLTKRLLDVAVENNAQTQELAQENQRLQLYPQVFCHTEKGADGISLVLQNLGDKAAGDVDVLLVCAFADEDAPYKGLIKMHGLPKYQESLRSVGPGEDGFYGVYFHFVYFSLPPRRQVRVPIDFPVPPDLLHALLQFRDVLGNNYYRFYWMFLGHPRDSRFRIGSIDPSSAKTYARLDFSIDSGPPPALVTTDGSPLPPETETSDFAAIWAHSVSSGYFKQAALEVEDAGTWSDA